MKPILYLLIWLYGITLFAKGNSPLYYVKKEDTLSEIALKHFGQPVYSKNGSLYKLLNLNPQIAHPKKIFPGDVIYVNKIKRTMASENDEFTSKEVIRLHNEQETKTESKNESLDEPKSKNSLAYHLLLGATYNALTSTQKSNNAEAYVYSNLSPKLEVGMIFNWDKKTQTGFILSNNFYEFNIINNFILNNKKANESRLSFFYQTSTSNFIYKFSLSANNNLLLKTKSLNTLEIVNTINLELELGLSYILMKNENMKLSFGIESGSLAPFDNNDLQYTDGVFYKAVINQTFSVNHKLYGAKFYYLQKNMNTIEVKANRKQLGLDLYWQY